MSAEIDARECESIRRDVQSDDEEVRRLAVDRGAALPAAEAIPCFVDCLGDPSWRVRKAAVERLVACPETPQLAESLILALADGENPGRRNAAVEALIRCGPRVVPTLVVATSDEDVDVRKLAADALAGIGDESAAGCLVELLGDPDPNVRGAAADALGVMGGPDVERALLDTAKHSGEESLVRFTALRALARLETPVSSRELVSVLDDSVLRPAAFALLGRADDADAIECLLKGLIAGSRSSREAAMDALLRMLGRIEGRRADALVQRIREVAGSTPALIESGVARLADAALSARLMLVQFLGLLNREEVVVPILRAARDEAVAEVALATLEQFGEVAEDALVAAWDELDSDLRRNACWVLACAKGERSAERLLSVLDDSDPDLRIAAALALGSRAYAPALPTLVRRMEAAADDEDFASEEELAVLIDAIVELANPGGQGERSIASQAVELLRAGLEGASESVRTAVATALGRLGRAEETQLVAFLLKDPSSSVRRAAVDGLAHLDSTAASEPIRLALADESPGVRIAAATALGRSGSLQALEDLKRLMSDEDARVRAAAVRAIGVNRSTGSSVDGRERIGMLLGPALADDATVALAAIEALHAVGGPEAARAACGALGRDEPELVQSAVKCIGVHGDADSLEELLPIVAHSHWTVRAEAIGSLAQRGVVKGVPAILRRLETEQDDFVRTTILQALQRLEG